MTQTTYRMAGPVALADATRARLGRAAVSANVCPWPIAAQSMATKPATQKFVDVHDHRRRRLSEPSP